MIMGMVWKRPLPTGTAAGRRIGSGNSDRAGAADRGSRRRAGAVFSVLEPSSACGRVMGRSAGPMIQCCHAEDSTAGEPAGSIDNLVVT